MANINPLSCRFTCFSEVWLSSPSDRRHDRRSDAIPAGALNPAPEPSPWRTTSGIVALAAIHTNATDRSAGGGVVEGAFKSKQETRRLRASDLLIF